MTVPSDRIMVAHPLCAYLGQSDSRRYVPTKRLGGLSWQSSLHPYTMVLTPSALIPVHEKETGQLSILHQVLIFEHSLGV